MREQLRKVIEKFDSLKVLVIGDAILDTYIKGTSNRLCREAPVPVIDVKEHEHDCGGAANTAINVASLGADTYFLSVTGRDDSAKELMTVLERHKVRTECVIRDKERTTLSKKRITASSNILLRVDDGSTSPLSSSLEKELGDKLRKIIKKMNVVILSDYGYGVITDNVIEQVRILLHKNPKVLIADSKNLERFKPLRPTAVKPNYEESVNILKQPKLDGDARIKQIKDNAINLLLLTGAECVAATMDADGTFILQNGKDPFRIHATPQDNKRSIGAGDTFISAFSLSLGAGTDALLAGQIAAAAASIVLQKEGTDICTGAELKLFFNDSPKYISSRKELAEKTLTLKKEGKNIVFTNGCFDILHRGHVSLLNQASDFGDVLIVGINGDASIKRIKGNDRPINSLEDRITVLAGLQSVTYLVSFEEDTPDNLIKIIKPKYFVKGGDYTEHTIPESALVNQLGGEVKIIPILDNRSTTTIIEKIKEKTGIKKEVETIQYAKASGME